MSITGSLSLKKTLQNSYKEATRDQLESRSSEKFLQFLKRQINVTGGTGIGCRKGWIRTFLTTWIKLQTVHTHFMGAKFWQNENETRTQQTLNVNYFHYLLDLHWHLTGYVWFLCRAHGGPLGYTEMETRRCEWVNVPLGEKMTGKNRRWRYGNFVKKNRKTRMFEEFTVK